MKSIKRNCLLLVIVLTILTNIHGQIAEHDGTIVTNPDWSYSNVEQGSAAGNDYLIMKQQASTLESPLLNLVGVVAPSLSFNARTYGGVSGNSSEITISVSLDNGQSWEDQVYVRVPSDNALRAMAEIDLSDYSENNIVIRFQTLSAGSNRGVGVDEILIEGQAGYYDSTEGLTGFALWAELTAIIADGHINHSYDNARARMYSVIDNVGGQVRCIYTGEWINHAGGSTPPEFSAEHTYCNNWYGGHAEEAYCESDLHSLHPARQDVNSSRGNDPFDYVTTISRIWGSDDYLSYRGTNAYGFSVFDVADEFKGNVARAILYFAVRYYGDNSNFTRFEVNQLPILLQWHALDPVDQREIDRNESVYEFQGNRNPFIDRPEFVADIWGDVSPLSPLATEAANIVVNGFRANWETVTDADSYLLDVSSSPEFVGYVDGYKNVLVSDLFYELSGLTQNTPYYYRVRAVKNSPAGLSLNSNTIEVQLDLPDGIPYSESFRGFVSAESVPFGWLVSNETYIGNWGSGTTAGLRGNANVLGFQHTSATGTFTVTLRLINDSGAELNQLFVSYRGMTERSTQTRSPEWTVKLNDTEIPELLYSTDSGVDATQSYLITGVSISENESFTLQWSSNRGFNTTGASKQIGIGDVEVSGIVPVANDTDLSIPENTSNTYMFPHTGVEISFGGSNPAQKISSYRYDVAPSVVNIEPEGSPVINVSPLYWTINSSAHNPGTYSITLDITNIPGIDVPAVLRLLKRESYSTPWQDLGIPSSLAPDPVNGPHLTWGGLDSFSQFALGGDEVNTLPVELSSFVAQATANNTVNLQWTAETETNMLGYNVYRSETDAINDAVKANFTLIPAHNTSSAIDYNYNDGDVTAGMTYYYWLQSNDLDLTYQFHGPVSVLVEEQGDPGTIPNIDPVTSLKGAYPNPFNPSTTIAFSLAEAAKVSITVYNAKGQVMGYLLSEQQFGKGNHNVLWIGKDLTGRAAASGIYFYRMQTDDGYEEIKKMILMK
jgi:hypothetical protein